MQRARGNLWFLRQPVYGPAEHQCHQHDNHTLCSRHLSSSGESNASGYPASLYWSLGWHQDTSRGSMTAPTSRRGGWEPLESVEGDQARELQHQ